MHDVFISYKSDDSALAMKVVKALEENGIPCWIAERDIRTGSNYARDIPAAIRNAKFFILILTAKAQESPWVLKELDAAISQKKVILPLLFGTFQINDEMNFMISGVQYHDATKNLNKAVKQIIHQIQEITTAKQAAEFAGSEKQHISNSEEGVDTILGATRGFANSFKRLITEGAASISQEQDVPESEKKLVSDSREQETRETTDTVSETIKEEDESDNIRCTHCGSTNVVNRGESSGCGSVFLLFFLAGLTFFVTFFVCISIGLELLAILIPMAATLLVVVLLIHVISSAKDDWYCNRCGRMFVPAEKEENE